MLKKGLLEEMAKVEAEIQNLQLLVDGARTNRIARTRHNKAKERLRELVSEQKSLMREWLKERLLHGKEIF